MISFPGFQRIQFQKVMSMEKDLLQNLAFLAANASSLPYEINDPAHSSAVKKSEQLEPKFNDALHFFIFVPAFIPPDFISTASR